MSRIPVRRALISVHDKTGLVEFAGRLKAAGVEIVSSGGTAAALASAGLAVTLVSDVTKAAEMLGGRVKTLHPSIHGGILARLSDEEHRRDLHSHGIEPFELVVVNLYPFEATVAVGTSSWDEAIEQIDIGGPALIRAAAKNQDFVAVVTSPQQYQTIAAEIESGGVDIETRRSLAREAFFRTASYDAAIVNWLERADVPTRLAITLERDAVLRYGENPHQAAGLYRQTGTTPWWSQTRIVQGKEMSFNNYLDSESAWRLVNELRRPGVVIVKHNNPCGVAIAADLTTAFQRAWDSDPLAAFGGVVALNRPLTKDVAEVIAGRFIEVLIAPQVEAVGGIESQASLRILEAPPPHGNDLDLRRVEDGLMVQKRDVVDVDGWEVLTARIPTVGEREDLELAWRVAAHTRSNSVVLVTAGSTVGVGAGDQSRIGAARKALHQAGDRAVGALAASDAFFPFPDGVELLAQAGIAGIVAPGGSKRDSEVLAAAERMNLIFARAPHRHFKH